MQPTSARTLVGAFAALTMFFLAGCAKEQAEPETALEAQQEVQARYTTYGNFANWDVDKNQQLTMAEVRRGLEDGGLFTAWDTNEDGELSKNEYAEGLARAWDLNHDGVIDPFEFTSGVNAWYPNTWIYGSFADWDEDGNQELVLREFERGVIGSGIFAVWDVDNDGVVSTEEYSQGLVTAWDSNGDGVIERNEYKWG